MNRWLDRWSRCSPSERWSRPVAAKPPPSPPSSTPTAASSTNPSTRASATAPRSSQTRPASRWPSSSPPTRRSSSRRMRRFAQRGQDPIIAVGFSQAVALEKVAKEFPNIHFTIIDMVVTLPNVQSVAVQGAGGLVPGRHAGGAGLQERQDRLRRRHGHPADPPLPVRLRAGRQVRQSQGRADRQHDRHDARRLERSGPRRRARQGPVRPRRRRGLCRRRRAPASACCRPPRIAASSRSASIPTRTTCIPARC